MKKRILTALLVFVMSVSVLPFSAFAKQHNNICMKKGHNWVESECTVCHTKCTDHKKSNNWEKKVVEPTCTAPGYTVRYRDCKICGKILEQGNPYNATAKLNHVYVKGKCSCGALATAPDANVLRCGHKYQVKSQQAPTCTEPGYIEHSCTNNCKRSYFKEIIRATGHTYSTFVEALEPTCTEKGHSAYTQCACGEKKNYTEIEATGHTYSISVAAKPVTCTENGHTAYTQCACGEKKDYTEIISSGHIYDIDVPAADATCIQGGHAAYKKCACGAEQTHLGTAIDPDAHDFENGVCVLCGAEEEVPETETTTPDSDEDDVPETTGPSTDVEEEETVCKHRFGRFGYSFVRATCTEAAHAKYFKVCKTCGEEYDVHKYHYGKALPHNYNIDVEAKAATCIEGGYAAHKKCACGEAEDHLMTTPDANAHHYVGAICEYCNKSIFETAPDTDDDGPAGGNTETPGDDGSSDEETDDTNTPTTTPDEDTEDTDAPTTTPDEDTEETACEHRFGRWSYGGARATCTEAAYVKYAKVCKDCGAEYDAVKFHFGRPLPHTYNIDVPAKAATCIEGGYAAHKKCVCGAEEAYDVTTVDPNGHKFVGGICEYCHKGTHDSDDADRELCDDHNWVENEETKVEPGCTTEGYVLYECSKCDGEYDAVLDPAGHHFADGVCVVCGASDPNAEDEEDDGTDEDGTESEDNESAGGNNESAGGSNGSSDDEEDEDENDTPVVPEKHPGCNNPSNCNGVPLDRFGNPDPTCTEPGVYEVVWPCGKLTTEVAPATGEHSFTGGVCEDCNAPDPSVEVAPPTTEESPEPEEPEEETNTKKNLLTWDWLGVNLIGNNKQ